MAVRKEGSPPKCSLLFHKVLPWRPCMKHHLKGRLIVFSVWHLQAHSSSSSTRVHHGRVNGSSGGHVAGGLEDLLIHECARWHPEVVAGVPDAGDPDRVNSRSVGHSACSCYSLWAQRYCLSVTHLSPPTRPTLLVFPALPFLGLLLVPLPKEEKV